MGPGLRVSRAFCASRVSGSGSRLRAFRVSRIWGRSVSKEASKDLERRVEGSQEMSKDLERRVEESRKKCRRASKGASKSLERNVEGPRKARRRVSKEVSKGLETWVGESGKDNLEAS